MHARGFQVFPASFRDLPPPEMELFDLDEVFSSERVRLAQITNKCKKAGHTRKRLKENDLFS